MQLAKRSLLAAALGAATAALVGCPSSGTTKQPGPTPTPGGGDDVARPGEPGAGTPVAEPDLAPEGPPAGKTVQQVSLEDVGLDSKALDKGVDPCDDFYEYACGGWLAANEIPADRSSYARFTEIAIRIEDTLKGILEAAVKANPKSEPRRARLGQFYAACMDEAAIEKAGVAPLKPLFAKVDAVKDGKTLIAAVVELHKTGTMALFTLGADQDAKDTTRVVAQMFQSGLGLPDKTYYTSTDPNFVKLKEAYIAHVEALFVLGGAKPEAAKAAAADVMEVEGKLAEVSLMRVEMRDPEKIYNKVARAEMAKLAPGFDWNAYLDAVGAKGAGDLILMRPEYFTEVAKIAAETPPAKMKNYLRLRVYHNFASELGKAWVDEDFKWTQASTGQPELKERGKRCVDLTSYALGEDLGQEFVAVMFPGDSKKAADTMVAAINQAFADGLPGLEWMDDETRARAVEKMQAMKNHIGFPAKWHVYDFKVGKGHVANILAAGKHQSAWQLSRIGKPVDREEWLMPPQIVNAYYNPTKNEMVFPAGILQPPFFSARAGVAVNLGAIGMVIGHELTHGFDDEGSQFAPDGNLKKWWSEEARAKFEQRTMCVKQQFDAYEILPGVKVDGQLTLGENIADLGGLTVAFRAYRALRAGAPETIVADGYTEDQQFFLGVGQIWCIKRREEVWRRLATTDPHSPGKWRVNGPLSNMPEFHRAWGCEKRTKMARQGAPLCKIW